MHIYNNTDNEYTLKYGGVGYTLIKGYNEVPNEVGEAYFCFGLNLDESVMENAIHNACLRWTHCLRNPKPVKEIEEFINHINVKDAFFYLGNTREEVDEMVNIYKKDKK